MFKPYIEKCGENDFPEGYCSLGVETCRVRSGLFEIIRVFGNETEHVLELGYEAECVGDAYAEDLKYG